jgi:hypothetical protein
MKNGTDSSRQAGKIEAYGSRGVWVPDGMTAHEIMVGSAILEREFDVPPYSARAMMRAILPAIRSANTDA